MNTSSWSSATDLVCRWQINKFKNLFITLIIVFIMMSGASAAPLSVSANHNNHKPVVSTVFNNPCGCSKSTTLADVPEKTSKPLTLVRKFLNLTITNYNHVDKKWIRYTYASTRNLTSQFKIPIPPRRNYSKKHHKMEHKVLSDLRQDLLKYGEAFEKLTSMEPHTHSSIAIKKNRTRILTTLKSNLKALVCEVETNINETEGGSYPKTKPSNIGGNWPENPDLTNLFLIDMGVFTHYIEFLKDRHRMIKYMDKKSKTRKRSANKPGRIIRHNRS